MKRKFISTQKMLNILKYIGIALVIFLILGLIGSLFTGSVGSGDGDGVKAPAQNLPSTEATEGTEDSSDDVTTESSTEAPEIPDFPEFPVDSSDEATTESSTEAPEIPDFPEFPVELSTKSVANSDNFNVYVGADDLKAVLDYDMLGQQLSKGVGKSEVRTQENGVKYVRIYGDGESNESYAFVRNLENKVTGQYLVFAYRLPETNVETQDSFEIFVTSHGREINGANDRFFTTTQKDGEWHVGIIDMAEAVKTCPYRDTNIDLGFKANDDGTYTISRLRFDWFTGVTSTDSYIDVSYIAVTDTIEKARSADPDYTGFEFTAEYINNLINKLDVNDAEIQLVERSQNGMPYFNLTSKVPSSGEPRLYLHSPSVKTLLGATEYIGIMYRNAPVGYSQIYANSTNVLTGAGYAAESHTDYITGGEWQFMVFDLSGLSDTVLRSLRFDFYNNQTSGETVSMDIAFIKFFDDSQQAVEYYRDYLETYNMDLTYFTYDDEHYLFTKGMTWSDWFESEYFVEGFFLESTIWEGDPVVMGPGPSPLQNSNREEDYARVTDFIRSDIDYYYGY